MQFIIKNIVFLIWILTHLSLPMVIDSHFMPCSNPFKFISLWFNHDSFENYVKWSRVLNPLLDFRNKNCNKTIHCKYRSNLQSRTCSVRAFPCYFHSELLSNLSLWSQKVFYKKFEKVMKSIKQWCCWKAQHEFNSTSRIVF